jgi:hypothetical protein
LVLRAALLSCASLALGLIGFKRLDHAIHDGDLVGVNPVWTYSRLRHAATIGLDFERHCLPPANVQL